MNRIEYLKPIDLETVLDDNRDYYENIIYRQKLGEQLQYYIKKRGMSKQRLSEITGVSLHSIGKLCEMKQRSSVVAPEISGRFFAVLIALRLDACVCDWLITYYGYRFDEFDRRDQLIKIFISRCGIDENVTVANCNKFLIDEGFEPMTKLLPVAQEEEE